jgi:PAS domain-containing protein
MNRKIALDAVLEPLYASVLEPARLQDFCAEMAQATGSHIGAIMVHDAQISRGRLDLLVGGDPGQMAAYEQEFAADNLWVQRSGHLMGTGAVLDSDTIVPREEFLRSRYYNEYLRAYEVQQSIAMCALRDEDGFVTATLCRSGSLNPYGEAELALLREISPHWVNAYAIQRRMSQLEQRVELLQDALDVLPMAMFLLDARQRIVRMNASAEAMLASGQLRLSTQGLTAPGNDAAALQRLLREATVGNSHAGTTSRHQGTLTLRDASGRHVLAASAHPLSPMQGGLGSRETAVLFVQPVGRPAPSGIKPLMRQLFGLTEAEAALAEAFHCHVDLAAAAAACGITAGTAQTRLKLIYAKTGEHSQPSLMRLMSTIAGISGTPV